MYLAKTKAQELFHAETAEYAEGFNEGLLQNFIVLSFS